MTGRASFMSRAEWDARDKAMRQEVLERHKLKLADLHTFEDIGNDAGMYVGRLGCTIDGEVGVRSATIGKQSIGDVCTLTRKVPGGGCISWVDAEEMGWTEIEITIDSGACDTVMPARLCSHISVLSTENSKRGMEYEVANGETIPNVGERHCLLMTEDSASPKSIVFQVADIHKPLLSVSRCADLGFQCVMGKHGGQLVDEQTGEVIPLHRRGNLYVMRAWVRENKSPDFTRPQ